MSGMGRFDVRCLLLLGKLTQTLGKVKKKQPEFFILPVAEELHCNSLQ
jgi:hypothetical protein